MAVFRIEKTRDYTVMSNHHLRDMSLSLKAKGLLSLMLSLPENWDYTMKGLSRICKDGIDSISGGIRELEEHGYLIRERVRGANGQLGSIEYTILEQPMIHEVLTNEIYTGDLVQGRHRVKSYKVHQIEAVPEEDWVRVPNTHEAIIDRATFEKVQSLMKRDTRTSPKGRQVHLFSGFLRCPDCGKALTRSVSGSHVYYACSTYKNRSRTACTMHSIKHNRLEAAVLFAIQQQVHLAVSYAEIIQAINAAPVKKCQSKRLDDLIAVKERELAKIARYKQGLYQDWKDGEITRDDYHYMKADYESQTAQLTIVLKNLTEERAELANGVDKEHPALVAFMRYQNIDRLTRDILVELVDHIKVYENGNISIRFKFADEFRKILEYIELNTDAPAKVV